MANGSVDLNNIYISCRYIYYDMLQCCSKDVAGGAIDLFAEKKRCKLTRIRAKYRTIHFPNGAVQCCCCIPTYMYMGTYILAAWTCRTGSCNWKDVARLICRIFSSDIDCCMYGRAARRVSRLRGSRLL